MSSELDQKIRIPLSVPQLDGNEWAYLKECLDTNFVSSVGPFVERFEHLVAEFAGARHAVATVNGTAGLHLALRLSDVRPEDEVLVSALTFIAPANAVRYLGAWPVFIDAEPHYWQMDAAAVERFLEEQCVTRDGKVYSRLSGRRIAAIVPVHILGHPVDLDAICEIAGRFQIPVVEDASEALGARYRGRRIGGGCNMCVFSFNGNKLITTGGGGMVTTPCQTVATAARHLTTQAKAHPHEYEHDQVGYNYRLTNLQAALGCAQMEEVCGKISAKQAIAARYRTAFEDLPGITLMPEAGWAESTFWLSTILVDEREYGMSSRALREVLDGENIESRPLWQPLQRSPAHQAFFHRACPVADHLWRTALSLPCSAGLREAEQSRVIDVVRCNRKG